MCHLDTIDNLSSSLHKILSKLSRENIYSSTFLNLDGSSIYIITTLVLADYEDNLEGISLDNITHKDW